MTIVYEFFETSIHGYHGIAVPDGDIKKHYPEEIKNKLVDFEGTQDLVENFSSSIALTGFDSKTILLDIFSIEVPMQEWRIGEAFAEFYLEKHKGARFYWNELRDQRNINSNKTGADLLGFIELNSETVFLFGEVKTSNDPDSPPQVLYGKSGMIKQLEELANDKKKIRALIRYIGTKAMLFPSDSTFRLDYEKALNTYIKDMTKYNLFGILVRDTKTNENDLKSRYKALKKKITVLTGLQLIALYTSIEQKEWPTIVNGLNE